MENDILHYTGWGLLVVGLFFGVILLLESAKKDNELNEIKASIISSSFIISGSIILAFT